MFTPPPSPAPFLKSKDPVNSAEVTPNPPPAPDSDVKRQMGRRTKWTVFLVPLALILITASTRYLTHPTAFDIFSQRRPADWATLTSTGSDWRPHKRHPLAAGTDATTLDAASTSVASGFPSSTPSTSPSTTSTTSTSTSLPTIPATPPTLPTPFPQPFDSGLTQNFTSLSCFNFFNNMTNTTPFRACRPFSLLLQSSSEFIEAQDNLTALNTIIWGTCTTSLSSSQCISNMAWFYSELQSACSADLDASNALAVGTLAALGAYEVMRNAGCSSDPSTNSYCYVNAIFNSNPSDSYFYSVPLGVDLPNTTTLSCSTCTKSLLALYLDALKDPTQSPTLTPLKDTYDGAASLADKACGTSFAQTIAASSGAASIGLDMTLAAALVILSAWTLLP